MMFSDVAMTVRDIDRSLKFYEALGFEISGSRAIRAGVAKVLEIKGPFTARMAYIRRNGFVLELVEFTEPTVSRAPTSGLAQGLGLGHIGIRVDNVDRVAKIIEANGGKVLRETRLTGEGRDLLFCTDPDGTRVELIYVDPDSEGAAAAPARGVRR
jgi:catechol 2,3-dioxygenase-like lactoylglutathione lyase family enzyme